MVFPYGVKRQYYNYMETFNYTFTSKEDDCLTEIISYFFDLGLPEEFDSEAFDSVSEKILLGSASA